jgi:hypothetical protein
MRDLGALPPDTDLEAVIADLRLDLPPIDPTTLTGEIKQLASVDWIGGITMVPTILLAPAPPHRSHITNASPGTGRGR